MEENVVAGSATPPPSSRSSSRLNLPQGVFLRLDTVTTPPSSPLKQHKQQTKQERQQQPPPRLGFASGGSPSPSRNSYSDRFIPSRSGSNLSSFALQEKSPSASSSSSSLAIGDGNLGGREDGGAAYSMLLRTELFGYGSEVGGGPLSPSTMTSTPEKTMSMSMSMSMVMARSEISKSAPPLSPSKNIFRFKTGSACSPRPESPYSLSPVGIDGALSGSVASPRKAPRKIPRSPYKVCHTSSYSPNPRVCNFLFAFLEKIVSCVIAVVSNIILH